MTVFCSELAYSLAYVEPCRGTYGPEQTKYTMRQTVVFQRFSLTTNENTYLLCHPPLKLHEFASLGPRADEDAKDDILEKANFDLHLDMVECSIPNWKEHLQEYEEKIQNLVGIWTTKVENETGKSTKYVHIETK